MKKRKIDPSKVSTDLVPAFDVEQLEERLEFVGTWVTITIHTGPDCPPPPPADSSIPPVN